MKVKESELESFILPGNIWEGERVLIQCSLIQSSHLGFSEHEICRVYLFSLCILENYWSVFPLSQCEWLIVCLTQLRICHSNIT